MSLHTSIDPLVEWVRACAPPGHKHCQTDSLEDASKSANSDGVEWALLGDDLGDELCNRLGRCASDTARLSYRWSRAGEEDQATQVCGALVAEGAGGIDERTHTVRLDGGASEGGTPCSGGRCSLLRLEELLLRVGGLGLAVSLAEDGAKDGEGGGVVEDGAERDG
jgi:hypothetical protein